MEDNKMGWKWTGGIGAENGQWFREWWTGRWRDFKKLWNEEGVREREGREGFKKELEEIKRWGRRGSYEELMKLESREYKKEAWKVSPRD